MGSLAGDERRVARIADYPLELTAEERERAQESLRNRRVPPAFADLPERMLRELPERRPGYDAMVVDADGEVWLREYTAPEGAPDRLPWFVFDSAGVWLGRVLLPGEFEPYEIGTEYLLGRWTDELGVESIRLLPLRR